MASSGEAEILLAARMMLISDPLLAQEGVFLGSAPREDDLPYVLLSLRPMPTTKTFKGTAAQWRQLQVKVCAAPRDGYESLEVAKPLLDAAYTLFTVTDGDGSPKDRLNATLVPLGFSAMVPLEGMPLESYEDRIIGDVVRTHYGHNFDLRYSQL